jgi:hypothetical protein
MTTTTTAATSLYVTPTDDMLVVVLFRQTGSVVYRTTYANKKRARMVRDRKDNAYGSYAYSVKVEVAPGIWQGCL